MIRFLSQSAFYIAITNSTSNFISWFNKQLKKQTDSNSSLLTNSLKLYTDTVGTSKDPAVVDTLLGLICSLFLIDNNDTTNDIVLNKHSLAWALKDLEDVQINISTTSGQGEIDRLLSEIESLNTKMKDLENKIQEERSKYNEYRQGWSSAQFTDNKTPAQYRQEWDRDVKSKEDAETRSSKLQDDLNKANDRIKALELEKSDVTAQIEQLNNIIAELKKKLSECEDNKSQDVAKLNSDISSLQTEIAKLKATIAQLERDKKELESTKSVLDNQIATQNKKISDLLKQIQSTLNEAYNRASDYNQKVISFNSSILGENSILKQIEEGWKEVIDKTVSNESELELSLTELEKRILEYNKKYGGIVDLRTTLDKTMQSAIENSQAMREFVYKITDNINGLLLSKKSLLGQSTTTVDNEVDALTSSITKIVKEISEMLANNNFDQEKVMKQITIMNEGVKGYFNDKMQVRFNNNKKINMLVDKIMEIVSKYPTPEEIKVLINENLNKLVYHFTKKALLAFDEIKNKMYNRY
jgi:epidermal growth factor receptor substrate 15